MIQAVFFDAGETLLSPNPSWSALTVQVLRDRGHDVELEPMMQAWREVGHRFRQASVDGERFSLSDDASKEFWTSLYHELLSELGLGDEGAPLVLYETFSNPDNYRLFPDALGCLDALQANGYRLGLISNFERWLGKLLVQLRIDGYFEVAAISGELGWEKPDSRIFAWAVQRAGLEPSVCAYVGDQPFFDAEASREFGMHGILLDRYGRFADQELPYPVVRSLQDLPSVLERMATPG